MSNEINTLEDFAKQAAEQDYKQECSDDTMTDWRKPSDWHSELEVFLGHVPSDPEKRKFSIYYQRAKGALAAGLYAQTHEMDSIPLEDIKEFSDFLFSKV